MENTERKCDVSDLFSLFEDTISPADVLVSKLMAQVSAALTNERLWRHMDQSVFAKHIGVTRSQVSRWEQGDYNFSIEEIAEIAAKLNLDVDMDLKVITEKGAYSGTMPPLSETILERSRFAKCQSQCSRKHMDKQREAYGMDNTGKGRPWYVGTDWAWYRKNFENQVSKAIKLENVILDYMEKIQEHYRDRTTFTEEFARNQLNMSSRTFYRKLQGYQEAQRWAAKLERKTAKDYSYLKILALCRRPKEDNKYPSIPEDMKRTVKRLCKNRCVTKMELYKMLQDMAPKKGWENMPSYQTIVRYVTALEESDVNACRRRRKE